MPSLAKTYDDIINDKEKIKEQFLRNCIDQELAFVVLDRDIIFHVLRTLGNPLRVVAFKETEFNKFFNDGTVIAFKDSHKGCLAMHEGEENILKFMELNLPFKKYSEFEAWMFNQV